MKENSLVVKGEMKVAVPAEFAYSYLEDERNRTDWDTMMMCVGNFSVF